MKIDIDIDFGLVVAYDGKAYTLMCPNHMQEYPIGGLICEYCRLAPTDIKEIILECHGLENAVTPDNVAPVLMEFHNRLYDVFPPVTATMISLEFQNAAQDWMAAIRDNCTQELSELYTKQEYDQIQQYILKDTPYQEFGCATVFQIMLSCYYSFAQAYINTKYMFEHIVEPKEGQEEQRVRVITAYSEMCSSLLDIQHIDFRILSTAEKGLESLFTIKSSLSLLLFEITHSIQINQTFIRCSNCGHIFVPLGRSDAIYCLYPSPQSKSKTCREVGAQIARSNKEKNDVVTKEYRKAYMRYQMKTKRHPYDREKQRAFEDLTKGMKSWRKKLADGTATAEEFLEWLKQFK